MADVAATLKNINASSFKSDEDRKLAVKEAHALLSRIESPAETAFRLTMTIPPQMACLKAAYDMELFQKWLQKNNGSKASTDELNNLVQCDPALLIRLLRHLASSNMLTVDERGMHEMTPFTISLVKDNLACMLQYFFDLAMPLSLHLPTFFDDIKYQNPNGNDKDCFRHWKNQSAWEYLAANPPVAKNIGEFMETTGRSRGTFSEIYPCEGLNCPDSEVLFVDIGGSLGHDLQAFHSRFPNASGRLILQDLPNVIQTVKENGKLDPSIEPQAYDFFSPQLVKGTLLPENCQNMVSIANAYRADAQFYLLHTVLHDCKVIFRISYTLKTERNLADLLKRGDVGPDVDAINILTTLKPAMKKGYSKLLVHEVVVSATDADVEVTTRDLVMMYMGSGSERTKSEWMKIFDAAGFKINKIWRSPLYAESIIELEIA